MALDDDTRHLLEASDIADLRDPAEVLESERVFDGKVWDVRRDRFRLRGEDGAEGVEMVREYVAHTGAVAVLAIDDDDRVLLINQYRHPIRARDWEIPAGLLDVEGEDPLVAAQRELAEEVDLEADEWTGPIAMHTTPGGSDEVVRIYVARGLRSTPEPFPRTEEEAEIVLRWTSLDDAVAAVLDGRLKNAILMVAVLAADARRRR